MPDTLKRLSAFINQNRKGKDFEEQLAKLRGSQSNESPAELSKQLKHASIHKDINSMRELAKKLVEASKHLPIDQRMMHLQEVRVASELVATLQTKSNLNQLAKLDKRLSKLQGSPTNTKSNVTPKDDIIHLPGLKTAFKNATKYFENIRNKAIDAKKNFKTKPTSANRQRIAFYLKQFKMAKEKLITLKNNMTKIESLMKSKMNKINTHGKPFNHRNSR